MSIKVSSIRRAASLAAAGCTAVGAVALAGTPAHAQVRPASCTVINIGQPGKIYVAGVYAGEVEQQYDNCHDVRSHFQWSSAFRSANPSAYVALDADYGTGTAGSGGGYAYQSPDAYSTWAYIYTNGATTWRADAIVDSSACGTGDAYGDYHDYATGAEFGSPSNASC